MALGGGALEVRGTLEGGGALRAEIPWRSRTNYLRSGRRNELWTN